MIIEYRFGWIICICIYVYMYIYTCNYVSYTYIYIYLYIHIYIYVILYVDRCAVFSILHGVRVRILLMTPPRQAASLNLATWIMYWMERTRFLVYLWISLEFICLSWLDSKNLKLLKILLAKYSHQESVRRFKRWDVYLV